MATTDSLLTPAILVDIAKVESNMVRAQDYSNAHGLPLRPHIKTHKLPSLARRQVELGAIGITCQKIGEAQVMADHGLDDIFIPYNLLGALNLERLKSLTGQIKLSVTTDNMTVLEGYAHWFTDSGNPLEVLVECDTGAGRCGVQNHEELLVLAQRIDAAPGLRFGGLMTYPPNNQAASVDKWLQLAAKKLSETGLEVQRISNGGSPDLWHAHEVSCATEHRPGTYVYMDRMQCEYGSAQLDDCALTVMTTVVSMPTADRAIIDAGSKALTSDLCSAPGYGHIVNYPDAVVSALSEEHGIVDLSVCRDKPKIGERLAVIPNHVCPVSNLFDVVNFTQGSDVIETIEVAARGRVQ